MQPQFTFTATRMRHKMFSSIDDLDDWLTELEAAGKLVVQAQTIQRGDSFIVIFILEESFAFTPDAE